MAKCSVEFKILAFGESLFILAVLPVSVRVIAVIIIARAVIVPELIEMYAPNSVFALRNNTIPNLSRSPSGLTIFMEIMKSRNKRRNDFVSLSLPLYIKTNFESK